MNKCLGILVTTDTKEYERNSILMRDYFEEIREMRISCNKTYHPPEDHYEIG